MEADGNESEQEDMVAANGHCLNMNLMLFVSDISISIVYLFL